MFITFRNERKKSKNTNVLDESDINLSKYNIQYVFLLK